MNNVYVVTTIDSELLMVHSTLEKAQDYVEFLKNDYFGKKLVISQEKIDDPFLWGKPVKNAA